MASMGKFIFLFLFLVSFSSIRIQARESKFFSKFMDYSTKKSISDAPVGEPLSAPAPAPVYTESNENGYGLYGHETGLFPPSKKTPATATTSTVTTTTTEDENELLNQELDSHAYEKGYQGNNYNNNGYYTNNYNNNGYTTTKYNNNGYNGNYNNNGYYANNYNSNGYTATNYNNNGYNGNYNNNEYKLASASYVTGNQNNNGYTTYSNNNNGYYTNNYNNNNGYMINNYNNNGYETERQGMSDTRFMEGGRYYHDVKNENNYYPTTGFESEMTNTKYPNEFNTMEEYENQEEYHESQDESVLP